MAADERYSQITVRYAELNSSKFSVVFPDADNYFERARDLIHQAAGLVSYDEDATDHLAENARLLLQAAVADLNRALRFSLLPDTKAGLIYGMRGRVYARLDRLREAERDLRRVADDEGAAQLLVAVRAALEHSAPPSRSIGPPERNRLFR